jgi:hypothetical protein
LKAAFLSLLHYLHKGHQRYENFDPTLSFEYLSISAIVNTKVRLNERLNQQTDEYFPSTSVNLSLKEKLDMAILNYKKCKNKGRLNVSKHLSKSMHKKIVVFEEKGTRGTYLQKFYKNLKTIKLTSVESKRELATLSPNYDHL